MKISWLYPQKKRCGISIYSTNYCKALGSYTDLRIFDPYEFIKDSAKFIKDLNSTDLVHIQYEPSLFFHGNTCFYKNLVFRINKPIIVSLHEVYDEDPHCFPRSHINGDMLFRRLKLFIYDYKHPFQNAYRKHLSFSFNASSILVHHRYQTDILRQKGINKNLIHLFPHPVNICTQNNKIRSSCNLITIGITGFINPDYNFDLLFSVLEKIDIEWEFWWIGGIRKMEHKNLLDHIRQIVLKKGWKGKFHITGWVSSEEQSRLIGNLDCALALFKNRSSSDSIHCILGNLTPVISTSLPLFFDINENFKKIDTASRSLIIISNNPYKIISTLKKFIFDHNMRSEKIEQINKFIHHYSFQNMSKKLFNFYQNIVNDK